MHAVALDSQQLRPLGQNGMDGSPGSPEVNGSQGEQGLPGSQVCTAHTTMSVQSACTAKGLRQ